MSPEEIKAIRIYLMLTEVEMAKIMGVTPTAVRHWESGLREPQGPAIKLMKLYGKYPRLVQESL